MARTDIVNAEAKTKAFRGYEKTARNYRNRRVDYRRLEAARTALCQVLGYERVHDHLGEYTNLHERDIPGCRHAAKVGNDLFSYSGYFPAVSAKTLRSKLAKHQRRSRELKALFMLSPVGRFLAGVTIETERNGAYERWQYRDGVLVISEVAGFLDSHEVSREPINPDLARQWFDTRVPECGKLFFVHHG